MRALLIAAFCLPGFLAAAQNPEDCRHAPFRLRDYPHQLVEQAARAETGDATNSVVGNVFARCEAGSRRVFVCGGVARQNRAGYIDRQRRFFGVYQADSGKFNITAVDSYAESACLAKVYTR